MNQKTRNPQNQERQPESQIKPNFEFFEILTLNQVNKPKNQLAYQKAENPKNQEPQNPKPTCPDIIGKTIYP